MNKWMNKWWMNTSKVSICFCVGHQVSVGHWLHWSCEATFFRYSLTQRITKESRFTASTTLTLSDTCFVRWPDSVSDRYAGQYTIVSSYKYISAITLKGIIRHYHFPVIIVLIILLCTVCMVCANMLLSADTALSALEVLTTTALYKFTYLLT